MNVCPSSRVVDLTVSLQPVMQTHVDASKLTSDDQAQFQGFTFQNESALGGP